MLSLPALLRGDAASHRARKARGTVATGPRDGRVTTAHPGLCLTNLLSATSFVCMQNTLPTEPTKTCLVDLGSRWSKRNTAVKAEIRYLFGGWGNS